MGHAQHGHGHVMAGRSPQQVVELRDQTVASFQGKALLAYVAPVQVALDAFCSGELHEHPAFFCGIQQWAPIAAFHRLANETPLRRGLEVHEFDTHGAAVHRLAKGFDVFKTHALSRAQLGWYQEVAHVK